jgi:hypothetical protein
MSFDVGGVTPPGMSSAGRAQNTSNNPSTQKASAVQTVLDALNIKGPISSQRLQGVQLPRPISATLASIQVLQPSPSQMEALRALGLEMAVLTLVVADQGQQLRLKERLKEVALSTVNREMVTQLESIFGTEIGEVVIDDNGALIVLNGLKELEKSIEEELGNDN